MNDINKNTVETIYIKEKVSNCDSIEDLRMQILPMLKNQQQEWSRKISEIISELGYTKSKLAEKCGVSRVAVDKWFKGSIPKSRETFFRIGLVAGYDLEKMNQLLQRYGQYPALYSKSLEDCVCIFVINQKYGDSAIDKYHYILDKIKKSITRNYSADEVEDIETEKFDKKLNEVQSEDGLEEFITDNIAMFANAYHKFYAYVKMNLAANEYANNVYELALGQEWSSSLRQCVSAIRQGKWYPTRNKIISLGLHLSMDNEQIDEMLELAHMEPLCAKNIFESVIIFILVDASLNDMLDSELDEFDPDYLCNYAREVLEELDIPELQDFLSELPKDEDWE